MNDCRIYAACLASYNSGRLYGTWIDCDGKDGDDLRAEIATMLRGSPCPNVMLEHPETGEQVASAEEWAIHDHLEGQKLAPAARAMRAEAQARWAASEAARAA